MVADTLHWILINYFENTNLFHYLDDFFFAGKTDTQECAQTLNDMLCSCEAVQAPLKPEKVLCPSTEMVILGIELGTVQMEARLPHDKLQSLLNETQLLISLQSTKGSCTKRLLLSLVGKLDFACKVIPAGRIFLRRLLDTAHGHSDMESLVHINDDALQDVLW